MARKTYKERQRDKKIRRTAVMGILLVAVVLIVAHIAGFGKPDVRSEKGFKEYAEQVLEDTQIYGKKSGKIKVEADEKLAVAVTGNLGKYEYTETYFNNFLDALKEDTKPSGEDEFRGITISRAVCESDKNTVSMLVTYTISDYEKGKMKETDQGVRTWLFNKNNGRKLVWQQLFKEDYPQVAKDSFGSRNGPSEWFMLGKKDLTYFFKDKDEETGQTVITPMKLLPRTYQGWLRDQLLTRYIDPDKPMVAITYDDGPGFKSEDRIHDVLEKYDAVATFFYVGRNIDGREDKIRRAAKNGCEIGGHTWSHPYLTRCSDKQLRKEVYKTHKLLKKVTGESPTVFRPSYGDTNDRVNKMCNKPVILWDLDTQDWKSRNPKKIIKAVKKAKKLDGRIILMHCIYDETAEATEKLVPWLDAQGYQMVTVSELIQYKTGKAPKNGKVYREVK